MYRLLVLVARFLYMIIFRVRKEGMENIPDKSALIICSNHVHLFDPATVAICSKRHIHFMAKKELYQGKFGRFILNALGMYPVDRSSADMTAYRTTLNYLKNGEVIGIFAQGTRVKTGDSKAAKSGVALFATKANALVVPVGISGRYSVFGKLTVRIGKPISFSEYAGKRLSSEELAVIASKIMDEVNMLCA